MGDSAKARSRAGRGAVTGLIPVERLARTILVIRGHRVMIDADLAVLYGVPDQGAQPGG